MKKKQEVFLSYDYDNERHYKNLVLAWNTNDDIAFKLNEADPSSAPSPPAPQQMIDEAEVFLVIVGKETHKSEAVISEIATAKRLGKKLVAVKTDRTNEIPQELRDSGVTWTTLNFQSIVNAIGKK